MLNISLYSHAIQHRQIKKVIKQVNVLLCSALCDLERQLKAKGILLTSKQQSTLQQARELLLSTRKSKNKIYGLHEPLLECISKRKANNRYEFGVKASFAVIAK